MNVSKAYVRKDDFRNYAILDYSDLKNYGKEDPDCMPVIVPDCFSGSDYGGDAVTRSNCRVMVQIVEEEKISGVRQLSGGYDSYGLAFSEPAWNSPRVKRIMAGLEGYPCLDDEDLSELEMEMEAEAWEGWAAKDFQDSLKEHLETEKELSAGALHKLFHSACKASNTYPEIEGNSGVYYDFSRIVPAAVEILSAYLPELSKDRRERLNGQTFMFD